MRLSKNNENINNFSKNKNAVVGVTNGVVSLARITHQPSDHIFFLFVSSINIIFLLKLCNNSFKKCQVSAVSFFASVLYRKESYATKSCYCFMMYFNVYIHFVKLYLCLHWAMNIDI
jgi:hypothetical protein